MDLFLSLLGLVSLFSVQAVQAVGMVATQVSGEGIVQAVEVEKEVEASERTGRLPFIKGSSKVIPLIPLK